MKKTTIKSKKNKKAVSTKLLLKSTPARAPGHRKLNIISSFSEASGKKVILQDSAVDNMSKADKMKRANSKNRRIISGATAGNKTGRIVYK